MGTEPRNWTHYKRIKGIEQMLLLYSQCIQLSTNTEALRRVALELVNW